VLVERFGGDAREKSTMTLLTFDPIYYADRVKVINPTGDVGVVTLWSKVEDGIQKLNSIRAQLVDPGRSRIAVIANLYGDGMFEMFCNLLNNPQVRYLVAIGQDLNLPTCSEISAFIQDGLEDGKVLGKPMKRIKGTNRYFLPIPEFDEHRLRSTLDFRQFGKFSAPNFERDIVDFFDRLPPQQSQHGPRIRVPIPTASSADYVYLPSDPIAHQIHRKRPLDCWEELIFRTMRFGRPVRLSKGLRMELQNVKVVISDPHEETADALAEYGFALKQFHEYQRKILDPILPETIEYTYGNRLRGYFGQGDESGRDTLRTAIQKLREDAETRHAYVSLWDTQHDLAHGGDDETSVPCLTTLFFRRSEERLAMTATYRSHNLLTAWLENVYGLMAIQRHVAEAAGMEIGPITVISHSLGINPASPRFVYAQGIESKWKSDDDFDRETGKFVLRQDPQGHFNVTIDDEKNVLVAQYYYGGVLIKRYEGKRSEDIEREVAKDQSISLVSHAMWLGRELARKEQLLKSKQRTAGAQVVRKPAEESVR
jgi:thymidylate synthase (methanogen type)